MPLTNICTPLLLINLDAKQTMRPHTYNIHTLSHRGQTLRVVVFDCASVSVFRYDGQVFVKPPEVLTRDRLLASYQVRPVLTKLRQTLLGAGVVLLTSSVLLVGLIRSDTDEDGVYGEQGAAASIRARACV